MITLPAAKNQTWPLIRILVMRPGFWTEPVQPWFIIEQPNRIGVPGSTPNGYELQFCDRVTLPEYGQAEFLYHYGMINGAQRDALDLTGYHVRIQGADEPADVGTTPVWRTIYLGTVDSQVDMPWSSGTGSGDRHYHCVDLLYRTSRWPLCHHSVFSNDTMYAHTFGHPGYNYAIAGYFRRLMGNRYTARTCEPFGDNTPGYICHTFIGSASADLWDDASVITHALWSSRAKGEPVFTLKNPGDFYDAFPWPVSDGEKCWSLLCRVLARQRGKGVAWLDWADDYSNPLANISPYINSAPQNYADLSYKRPSDGATLTFTGAAARGTSVSVDLVGDHRYVDGSLLFTVNDSTGVDYLETYGEQIETLVTLTGTDGTLEKRWTDADAAAFLAIPASTFWQRQSTRWKSVFQRWSIPTAWDYKVGDGDAGAKTTCVFNCDNVGAITAHDRGATTGGADSSPLLMKIGTDLPIYEGYNYAPAIPVRYDGAGDYLAPPRNPAIILVRVSSGLYVNAAEDLGFGMQVDDFGVFVMAGFDQAAGTRYFSGAAGVAAGIVGAVSDTALVISVGLTFGHRVRMANANNVKDINGTDTGVPFTEVTAGRKLYIFLPGAHLWLAHPSAIWEHNKFTATSINAPGKRAAAGGAGAVPGIIRDDRDRIAVTHALAWSWYGTRRTTAQWSLRACGLLTDFEVDGGTRALFPSLGKVVKDLNATSGLQSVQTPISRVHYNHVNGTTVWFTDWTDLDTDSL